MELTILAVIASLAVIMSLLAFGFSLFAFIEVQAQKRSTHTVYPVANNEDSLSGLEKQLKEMTGQNRGDLERDLHNAGLDVDDLV